MNAILKMMLVLMLLSILGGCSTFRPSRHIDMTPFADHTIALVADISYGLNQQHAVHLRRYMDDPAITAYIEGWDELRVVLRGIAAYSLAIVTVSKSNLSEEEKVEQLSGLLERLRTPSRDAPAVEYQPTRTELERILDDIRTQKTFLDGLGAAQPIVDWVAWNAGKRIDALKVMAQELEGRILERVEDDYAGVVEFDDEIRERQVRTLRNAMLLSEHRATGDPELIEQLRKNDPSLGPYLPAGNHLTPEQIERGEDRLSWRLAEYRRAQELLAADITTYNNMIHELDEIVISTSSTLIKTRATIWIWSRAHARLAAGITDPARVDIMGIAKRAMDAALPQCLREHINPAKQDRLV